MSGSLPDFRYPYDIQTTLDSIRSTFDDATVARLMDRDRALEDYVTMAAHAPFPFAVVADDGSGDYTSIKTAVEAAGPSTGNRGSTILFVKPSTTGYTDSGRVTPQAGASVIVWAPGSYLGPLSLDTPSARQTWNFDGFTAPATGTTSVTLIGLVASMQSSGAWVPSTLGQFNLMAHDCTLAGGTSLHDSGDVHNRKFIFSDSLINTTAAVTAAHIPTLQAQNCQFTQYTISSATLTQGSQSDGSDQISWQSCKVTINGTLSYSNTAILQGGARASILNCHLEAGSSTPSLVFASIGQIRIVSCRGDITALTASTGFGGLDGATSGIIFGDNYLPSTVVTMSSATLQQVSGLYKSLTVASNCTGDITFGSAPTNNHTFVTITGNANFITFQANNDSVNSNVKAVNVSGNNNTILYSTNGTFIADTNTGTGNRINTFPPSGAAGGDLGGTYPNPTVVHVTTLSNFTTKGDLLAGTGGTGVSRFGAGTDGFLLFADSSTGTGLRWGASVDIPKSVLTTKGDLIVENGTPTPDRLPVGTDGYVLTASSGATLGVTWASNFGFGGNTLTKNQASLETDTTGWAAASNCTISRSTAKFDHGIASLALTSV